MDNVETNQDNEITYAEFSLVDIIHIFLKNKKKILIFSLSIGLITAFYVFFIANPIFFSTGTVKTTAKAVGLSGMLSQSLPDIGELGDLAGSSSTGKELALYENILISRRCIEETIIKYKWNEDGDFKYMQDAVKFFRENVLDIKKDKIAGTMDIGIYDKDPAKAKEMAEFMISQLNNINIELNVLNAKNNREFIEARYKSAKEDLKKAEDSLKSYQDIYGIAPDIVVKAATQSEVQLEVEIKSEEVKLDLLKKILSPDQSEIKIQEEKIAAFKNQLSEMRNSTDYTSKLNLKGSPDIVMNSLRLQRDVEIQNKILTFIIPLFEQAKIEEKKETPSVLVLDQPNLPEKKVKPKRLTLTLISLIFAFLSSLSWFIIYAKWKTFKSQFLNKEKLL